MNKEYENWVEEMFEKYKGILFIEKYQLWFKATEDNYLASKCHYPYLNITIMYSEKAVEKWKRDKYDAETEIIHEFCHSITDPLYCKANSRYVSQDEITQERERLTDHISNIVIKLRKKNQKSL